MFQFGRWSPGVGSASVYIGRVLSMVDPEEFRKGLRSFTTGVTVVTVPDGKGGMHAMTASSFAAVSVDPQLASVSISKLSKSHDLLLSAGSYGVNFLCDDQ